MEVSEAIEIVNYELMYKPGWTLHAEKNERFKDIITLTIHYPTWDTNTFPCYTQEIHPHVSYPIPVTDCDSKVQFLYRVVKAILDLETHEAREFLKKGMVGFTPFHPHNQNGQEAWAALEEMEGHYLGKRPAIANDLHFGYFESR